MGWSSGVQLFGEVAQTINYYVRNEKQRLEAYKEIIVAFEDMDCDNLGEAVDDETDPVLIEALVQTGNYDRGEDL